MKWIVLAMGILSLTACGNNTPAPVTPASTSQARMPQSIEEGLRAQGYTKVTLARTQRAMTSSLATAPHVEGRQIKLVENAGWNASSAMFARKGDRIYLVTGAPRTIVDRHVNGGCLRFAGGRGWFEDVAYELPEGTTYGGTITIAYEKHVEITDHTDTEPDGSPCPPPAID